MCYVCSKELSHEDGSFEYPQHKFWLRNKKINFQVYSYLEPWTCIVTVRVLLYHVVRILTSPQGYRVRLTFFLLEPAGPLKQYDWGSAQNEGVQDLAEKQN